MNPEPAGPAPLQPATFNLSASRSPTEAAQPATCNLQPATGSRRHGKIARLPKTVRDQINHMLEDGLTYREILEQLGEHGQDLNEQTLSRWKDAGYKDWVAEQAFIARTRARQETPAELVRDFDPTEVNHAALQLGTLHIFEALRDLGPGSLDEKLGGDCMAFARLLNALARASRETLLLQKYRDACARARAAIQELKDPKRKLDESETRAIVLKVDDILGLRSTELDQAPPPSGAPPAPDHPRPTGEPDHRPPTTDD